MLPGNRSGLFYSSRGLHMVRIKCSAQYWKYNTYICMNRHLSNQIWKISVGDNLDVCVTDHIRYLCVNTGHTQTMWLDVIMWADCTRTFPSQKPVWKRKLIQYIASQKLPQTTTTLLIQGSFSSWNKKFKTFKGHNYDFSSIKIDGMQHIECAGCVSLWSK